MEFLCQNKQLVMPAGTLVAVQFSLKNGSGGQTGGLTLQIPLAGDSYTLGATYNLTLTPQVATPVKD